jgi:glycogen debranching enzyme
VVEHGGGVVVWPFVVGYAILALRKIGTAEALALAQEQTDKLRNIDCAEWYDPATGKGYGSPAQGWSASLRAQVL